MIPDLSKDGGLPDGWLTVVYALVTGMITWAAVKIREACALVRRVEEHGQQIDEGRKRIIALETQAAQASKDFDGLRLELRERLAKIDGKLPDDHDAAITAILHAIGDVATRLSRIEDRRLGERRQGPETRRQIKAP